jgi:hypothetical protein
MRSFAEIVTVTVTSRDIYALIGLAVIIPALILTRQVVVAAVLVCVAAIYVAFVFYRPSQSTVVESAAALIAITSMGAVALPRSPRCQVAIAALLSAAALGTLLVFPFNRAAGFRNMVPEMDTRRALLAKAQEAGHPIVAVVPDDRWGHGGPIIVLLKGLSEFPSWHVPPDRKGPLAVPISFRTEQGGLKPSDPYPTDVTIMWEDRLDLPPIAEKYPALKAAAEARNCQVETVKMRLWLCLPR